MQRDSLCLLALAALLAVPGCSTAPPRPLQPVPSRAVDLVVAATTDVHGRLAGWDYYAARADTLRGLARAATIVDSLRGAYPGRVLLVDAGDLLQGNPLTFVAARIDTTSPHPVIAAMNALRYDAAVVGNHEFNYGLPTLERAVSQAHFPFLAANVYRADGRHAFPAWVVAQRDWLKIGIVGATTPGSMVWDRENLTGRLVIRDIIPDVRDAVQAARDAGAKVVIVLLHAGLNEPASYDTTGGLPSENVAARVAHEVPGIDLIVYGHTHKQMADTVIGRTLLMQPKNWATSVGVAHLRVEQVAGDWRVTRRSATLVPTAGHKESPAVLAAIQHVHEATVRYAAQAIGSTPVTWSSDSARVVDTPVVDLILDVMRRTAGTDLASTAAFNLGASLPAGPITVAELARLYPYDNTLVGIRITGRQLRAYLEQSARYFGQYGTSQPAVDPQMPGYNYDIISGVDYTIDLSRPAGSRITRLERNGRPVRDDDSFTLALNNYRASGGGGFTMLAGAPVVYDREADIRQLLIDEVRAKGTIRPADYFTPNWTIVPPAAAAAAYRAMHGGRSDH